MADLEKILNRNSLREDIIRNKERYKKLKFDRSLDEDKADDIRIIGTLYGTLNNNLADKLSSKEIFSDKKVIEFINSSGDYILEDLIELLSRTDEDGSVKEMLHVASGIHDPYTAGQFASYLLKFSQSNSRQIKNHLKTFSNQRVLDTINKFEGAIAKRALYRMMSLSVEGISEAKIKRVCEGMDAIGSALSAYRDDFSDSLAAYSFAFMPLKKERVQKIVRYLSNEKLKKALRGYSDSFLNHLAVNIAPGLFPNPEPKISHRLAELLDNDGFKSVMNSYSFEPVEHIARNLVYSLYLAGNRGKTLVDVLSSDEARDLIKSVQTKEGINGGRDSMISNIIDSILWLGKEDLGMRAVRFARKIIEEGYDMAEDVNLHNFIGRNLDLLITDKDSFKAAHAYIEAETTSTASLPVPGTDNPYLDSANEHLARAYGLKKKVENVDSLISMFSFSDKSKLYRIINLVNSSEEAGVRNYSIGKRGKMPIRASESKNPLDYDDRLQGACVFPPFGFKKSNIIEYCEDPNWTLVKYEIKGKPLVSALCYREKDIFMVDSIEGSRDMRRNDVFDIVYKDLIDRASEHGASRVLFNRDVEGSTARKFLGYVRGLGLEKVNVPMDLKTSGYTESHNDANAYSVRLS